MALALLFLNDCRTRNNYSESLVGTFLLGGTGVKAYLAGQPGY